MEQLKESLGFLVNGLARVMRMELENRLRDVGLTPTMWTVMMSLGENNGQSQTDLSRRTFLDNATITRALDLLEAKGLIERNRDLDDRRVQIVTLTTAGTKAWADTAPYGRDVNIKATDSLKASERKYLVELVRKSLAQMTMSQEWNGGGGGAK